MSEANTPKSSPKKDKRRGLQRFRRDSRGATAVEFGLVAIPFFALMMAILETFLLFFASQTIETATNRGARLIRTGQAQTAGMTEADFKTEICSAMAGLFNCSANLRVDVRTYEFFDNVDLTQPVDDDGNLIEDFIFQPGDAGDVVVVRAFYEWPIHTNILGLGLASLANVKHLIAAATAFRNEPF